MPIILDPDKAILLHADCSKLTDIPDCSIDAVVTDPPYELSFMNKAWDNTGIAASVLMWREIERVLKPGAHLLAFGGTRTYHRMVCAIEDAGFVVRDSLHWLYGSGFPKSMNAGEGRGTALKPGHEPIVMARKPLEGTVEVNLAKWGTGALNIDACRLAGVDVPGGRLRHGGGAPSEHVRQLDPDKRNAMPAGRWPSNVLLDEGAAEEVGEASRFFYVAKPSRSERDLGCEALPQKSAGEATDREDGTAGLDNPRAGAGRTGGVRNFHPTVKPVQLMRYLCRLVTPPGGVVLDPFLGSGTTGVAALAEGFSFIGVEKSEEYLPIAVARIKHALKVGEGL